MRGLLDTNIDCSGNVPNLLREFAGDLVIRRQVAA